MKSKLLLASTVFAAVFGLSACSESPAENYLGQLNDFAADYEELAEQDSVCKSTYEGMDTAKEMLDPRAQGIEREELLEYEADVMAILKRLQSAEKTIRRKLDKSC